MEINEHFLNKLGFTMDKYWLKTTIGKLKTDNTSYFSFIPNEILNEIYKYICFDIYPYKLYKTTDFCLISDVNLNASIIQSNIFDININYKYFFEVRENNIKFIIRNLYYHKPNIYFTKKYDKIFKISIYEYPTTDFYHSLLHTKIMNDIKND